ncbi:sugar phosphate isomerase/epimerase family protein [Zhihengliuella flava]|uniref:Sugar phosphate isomerase/epimerase n=1 Tax=Zhihengliuella flava TaxID=1285193 RepID=A0A931D9V5_9MICC|nr:sugar phosphate isomerase/epimerase family protein [Zhihengliuella flava]MBG6085014.1 sugar phosphate isomerase/epimerase [Zhihengliuella flava]
MPYTADTWPITAALLQFPHELPGGGTVQDADASHWKSVFATVRDAGFANVDLLDSWIRPGDLTAARLDELKAALGEVGVGAPALSAIRRSVIDAQHGQEHLAYAHRTLEAAAHLGCEVVSFGLHQALTPEQQQQLWFWTVPGHQDPVGDQDVWATAVRRLRELGEHARELGLLMSLEMYEDTFLGTADSAVALVQEIGLDNVGLNPDLGNLVRVHRPIEDLHELIAKTMPYANYWHVKNYLRDENTARGHYSALPAPLETGVISYREALEVALAHGFQGIICCEHYGGDGLSVSATNQRFLREMLLPKTEDYALGTPLVAQGRQTPAAAAAGDAR